MMVKRIFAALSAFAVILSASSCSVNKTDAPVSTTSSTTLKETRIHNNFKDVLPKFDFENEVNENYNESIEYSFNVKCSENECKKYIKSLKKAGYVNRVTETDTYYTALTDDGYFVEMTYINGTLTLYTKKIA